MKYKTDVWQPFRRQAYRDAWMENYLLGILQEFGRDMRRCHERIWRGYCDFDIFSIHDWFLGIMPTMLEDFRDHLHGCPDMPDCISHRVCLDEEENDNPEMSAWKETLTRIIFLLKEANEETCSRKNPYQDEYDKAWDDFQEKYGPWGEKLMTDQEKEKAKNGNGHRVYMLGDVEEYKPISEKYYEQYHAIKQYQHDCKDKALELFSKWFYDLWD